VDDVIQVDDKWYIAASSHQSDTRTQVLKEGDTFAVFDRLGEIGKTGHGEQGLYHRGMRHLSRWEMLIQGRRTMLLNSTMKRDNSSLVVELTTPDIQEDDHPVLPKGVLHASRSLVMQESTLYEHLTLGNYAEEPLDVEITYRFDADFHDMFEVRGTRREKRGELLPAQIHDRAVILAYRGLDGVLRRTGLYFDHSTAECQAEECRFRLRLMPRQEEKLSFSISCQCGTAEFCIGSHSSALRWSETRLKERRSNWSTVVTSNEAFNEWLGRSMADLQMLTTDTIYGRYPYAGVPWFSTPFGRDGLITALQTLWLQPQLSQGVLNFLAETQATEKDPQSDAEPGKILHEMREGEMSALGEVPFRRYYGTIDATPLFLVLAGRYFHRTGDLNLIQSIWPNLRRALQWIDDWGDADGDGFVEYQRQNSRGLVQQGWKDSDDSIFHADGTLAEGPIALCEVQGYVYEAKRLMAELAEEAGELEWSRKLCHEAEQLKEKFNATYWVEELGTFAIALDGRKRRCEVLNSNAGHLLYNGIVAEEHAARLVETLIAPRSFNGWGIRTIAENEPRYNPMSYHNGSVWPHDTALIAAGMARYRHHEGALKILNGLSDAADFLDISRLPELFCGFPRLQGHAPTLYPVACSPQAWASGSVFMALQGCLGLTFSHRKPQVRFDHPVLPDDLQWIRIENLRIGGGELDFILRRHPRDVGLNIERKEGDIEIVLRA